MPEYSVIEAESPRHQNSSHGNNVSISHLKSDAYAGLAVTLVGNGPLPQSIAENLAVKGISELLLAATDLLAPASAPTSTFHPAENWAAGRAAIKDAVWRRNSAVPINAYAHGNHPDGPRWQRCATARADVVVCTDRNATSRLVNLICLQQVTPALYARFDPARGVGEICFVTPRCSNLQYRSFPSTCCWECTQERSSFRGTNQAGPAPTWFAAIVSRYLDAILLENQSDFAFLLRGPNLATYSDNSMIESVSPVAQHHCMFCS